MPDNRLEQALGAWEMRHSVVHKKYDEKKLARALYASQWFIENVAMDAPDRQEIFFKVRELCREAWK